MDRGDDVAAYGQVPLLRRRARFRRPLVGRAGGGLGGLCAHVRRPPRVLVGGAPVPAHRADRGEGREKTLNLKNAYMKNITIDGIEYAPVRAGAEKKDGKEWLSDSISQGWDFPMSALELRIPWHIH